MRALRFHLAAVAGCAFMPLPVLGQQAKAHPAPAFEVGMPVLIEGDLIIRPGDQAAVIRALSVRALHDQARYFVQVEHHRTRMACDLTADQSSEIIGEVRSIFVDARKQIARASRFKRTTGPGAIATPGWLGFVDDALARAVMSHTRPDQWARYRAEIESRDLDRKEAAILRIVAELDHDLYLSARQRDQLRSALALNWSDAWSIAVDVPDVRRTLGASLHPHVVPLLSAPQNESWVQTGDARSSRSRRIFSGFWDNDVVCDEMLGKALDAPLEDTRALGGGVVRFPAR